MTKISARKFQFKLLKVLIKISHRITFRIVRTHYWDVCSYCFATERLLLNPPLLLEDVYIPPNFVFWTYDYYNLVFRPYPVRGVRTHAHTHARARARACTHTHTHTGWAWSPTHLQKLCVCVCVCVCRLFIYVPCKKVNTISVFSKWCSSELRR